MSSYQTYDNYYRAYRQRPEPKRKYLAYLKEYWQRPGVKEKHREVALASYYRRKAR